MTLSIRNFWCVFLIRLDLMLTMSLWNELQLLQILKDLPSKYLIKHENDVKL